jgi:hypothetical protein
MNTSVLGPADKVQELDDLARHAPRGVRASGSLRVTAAAVIKDEDGIARIRPKVLDLGVTRQLADRVEKRQASGAPDAAS